MTQSRAAAEWLSTDTRLVEVLSQLVSCRSDNPGSYERDIAALTVDILARWTACEVHVIDSMPNRPCIAAVLPGVSRDAPTLVLNGHLDTVPVDDQSVWTVPPFTATLNEGRLYGRGACDMKAGLTAQIAVASILSRRDHRLPGTLILHFAAGEERAEPGTASLLDAGFGGTFGIVTEPTDLLVADCARGLVFFEIGIRGRSVHSSRPDEGVNPIEAMTPVLETLRRYGATIRTSPHPYLPGASCTPTQVHGGEVPNMIPDTVHLTADRRLLPGEDPETERQALQDALDSAALPAGVTVTVNLSPIQFAAAASSPDGTLSTLLREAATQVTGTPTERWGTPYSSDMRVLVHDAGMEAVTFGPGSICQAHAPDEFVRLAQVRDAATILLRTTERLLGDAT